MAELNPVHRYAAGALLGLALHQAQIHQCFSPPLADICTSERRDSSTAPEFDEKDTSLWSNYHSGLLRPIFRYLKIDSKAWAGLEQTALSTDAKSHIGAFLRILSEEEENTSAEVQLADAVDTLALTFEDHPSSGDSVLTKKPLQCGEDLKSATVEVSASDNTAQYLETLQASMPFLPSEICKTESTGRPEKFEDEGADVKNLSCERDDSTSSKAPFMEEAQGSSSLSHLNGTNVPTTGLRGNLQGGIIGCTSGNVSEGLPGIREDYFGSSLCENNPSVSEPSTLYNELETSNSAPEDIEPNGLREALMNGPEDTDKNQNFSLIDSQISESKLLTQQRKVAVLYELLSASVADITPEKDEDELRLRKGYDSRHRVALRLLATWLDVKWTKMAAMEIMIAYSAMAAQEEREANKDSPESKAKVWAKWKRGGLIGAAALTGGALLALTGGLAAPAIAAGLSALAPTLGTIVPVIGSTGFAAAAAAAGSTAGSVAVAASFGAAGAGLTGSKMARRTGGVEEFGFEGVGENHQQGRLAVSIVVSGFINDPEDFTKPWKGQNGDLERYALRWETKNLIAISTAIQDWLTSNISKELMKQGAMLTVLSTLLAALTWPAALLSLTDFIDSKWVVAVDRSDKAGKLLAEVLLKGLQGNRPVTLIGFSLGARVIFKCLENLAKKGENGRIVERVVLLGAPISLETQRWETVRKVVAGRFVNAYSTNDWLLAVVYRASLLSQGLAGIQAVNIPGIENVDVTDVINGHSSYLTRVGEILQAIDIDCYFPTSASKLIDSCAD